MFYHKSLRIDHFADVKLDQFVIMPNHIHGIIIITKNKRHKYIYSLLSEIDVPIKDNRRNFSKDYKDFLWNKLTENNKKPKCPICGKILDYDDAQVDHKYPHSEGGPTELENAQLVCSRCNKSKGDKIL